MTVSYYSLLLAYSVMLLKVILFLFTLFIFIYSVYFMLCWLNCVWIKDILYIITNITLKLEHCSVSLDSRTVLILIRLTYCFDPFKRPWPYNYKPWPWRYDFRPWTCLLRPWILIFEHVYIPLKFCIPLISNS